MPYFFVYFQTMKYMVKSIFFFLLIVLFSSCRHETGTLFRLVPSEESGITFANDLQENDTLNILTQEYIYNGGGVATGDFNNDGLTDIFFTGNMQGNKLYLNRGELHFDDVTEAAGVAAKDRWNQGVALADVNGDGLLDIYVCTTFYKDSARRANMLFVNQGAGKDGVPSFREEAKAYGIANTDYSTNAAFLDYDRDGDLDLYVLVNILNDKIPTLYREKINNGTALNNDRLYRNNGNGTFSDVTMQAGIVHEGYGLGIAVADINQDGWPDMYISNDYISNDILYINQHDGTFVNTIGLSMGHESMFSMGNDAADFNNDGLVDIVTLDMLGETSYRQKTTMGNKSYQSYIHNETYGYEYQYIRNMLQMNDGVDSTGRVRFSEIGLMSGIYRTDWSWSPLFADFDNDGYKDLIITNGFPKDLTDRDFSNFRSGPARNIASISFMLDSIPVAKIPNYAYRNNGDLTFRDVTRDWGMYTPAFSNGAAFADLDNDGDLDYLVNNINDKAFLYENRLYGGTSDTVSAHYLRVKLKGSAGNASGLGAKVTLHYGHGKLQFHDHSIYRGYISTVEDIIHFGLGNVQQVDTVHVVWPDGHEQLLTGVKANQVLTVDYALAKSAPSLSEKTKLWLVKDVHDSKAIRFRHREADKIDFNIQRTLPHKFSQAGPGLAVGDVNGDGLEDIVAGGSAGEGRTIFTQGKAGVFTARVEPGKDEEEEGLLLFDADGDGDQDLYCVTGSLEFDPGSRKYRDMLLRNDGKGNFSADTTAVPDIRASGSCVRAADFDGDGDLDLFVGGRTVPGSYPLPGRSAILQNDNGKFSDVTGRVCAGLDSAGMVTDALWTDFDADGKTDLLLVGEFMPLTFYKNTGKELKRITSGLEDCTGWWNSLAAADFDHDGDMDYIAGNLGLNNNFHASAEFPLRVYAKDFDKNGAMDPILACYFKASQDSDVKRLYPMHFWDELNSQSPRFRQQFVNYKHYARSPLESILTDADRKGALVLEARWMASGYVENLGNGRFAMHALPALAQVAPVNGIVVTDLNNDGHDDVVMVGNDYGNEVFAGRYDAFTGLVLLGNGRGGFDVVPSRKSGFYVPGDAKALVRLVSGSEDLLVASQNRDSLAVFAPIRTMKDLVAVFVPSLLDCRAELVFADGTKAVKEFYYGAGYLSQSSRRLRIPAGVKKLIVYTSTGASREIVYQAD